ncbi:MAG TPA: hypothetical protein VG650_15850 [Mycobacteriales bacterium]|nr:hypothetical protein [Mycobacteriales bacterium]
MRTTDFARLTQRLAALDRNLLLPQDLPLGNYSKAESDAMLGYRLLAHAEIEGYLEALAENAAQRVLAILRSRPLQQRAEEEIIGHVAKSSYPPRSVQPPPAKAPSEIIRQEMSQLVNIINGNNGVTEKDVLKMFLPLGIPLAWFDATWLRLMTTFAEARGDIAHNGWANATTTQLPPSQERAVVRALLPGLNRLTRRVGGLTRRL